MKKTISIIALLFVVFSCDAYAADTTFLREFFDTNVMQRVPGGNASEFPAPPGDTLNYFGPALLPAGGFQQAHIRLIQYDTQAQASQGAVRFGNGNGDDNHCPDWGVLMCTTSIQMRGGDYRESVAITASIFGANALGNQYNQFRFIYFATSGATANDVDIIAGSGYYITPASNSSTQINVVRVDNAAATALGNSQTGAISRQPNASANTFRCEYDSTGIQRIFITKIDSGVTTETRVAISDNTHTGKANLSIMLGPFNSADWDEMFFTDSWTVTKHDTAASTVNNETSVNIGLVNPSAGHETNANPIRFTWSSVDGDTFSWQLSKSSAFTTFSDSVQDTSAQFLVRTILQGEDTYFWRVIAQDTSNNYDTTAARGFLLDSSVRQGVTISPASAHDTTAPTIVFTWSALSDSVGIDSYAFELATTSDFTSVTLNDTVDGVRTQDTATGLAPATYYWRIRGIDDLGNVGANSTTSSLVVSSGAAPTQPIMPAPILFGGAAGMGLGLW